MTRNGAATVVLVLATALVLAAVPALAAEVKVDFDHKTDFAKYKTFTLTAGTPANTPFGQERLEEVVAAQLAQKGWTKVTEAGDVQVVTHVQYGTQRVADVSTFGYGGYPGWYGWGGSYGSSTVSVRDIPVGTLIIDIVDGSTKTLIWRGVASDTISEKADTMKKKVEKALAKMFKNFPPMPEAAKGSKK